MIRFFVGLALFVYLIVTIFSSAFTQVEAGMALGGFIAYLVVTSFCSEVVFPDNVYRIEKIVYRDGDKYKVERRYSFLKYVWWDIAFNGDEFSSPSTFSTAKEAEEFIKKELSKLPVSTAVSSPISVENIDSDINFKEIERT